MIRLLELDTKQTSLWVSLSDCWTENGKPVRFRLRKLQSPLDPSVKAISFILGPLSVKFGWITNDTKSQPPAHD